MKSKYIIFDLDDTLAYEINYLKSAYNEIAIFLDKNNSNTLYNEMIFHYEKGENVFDNLLKKFPTTKLEELLKMYRHHFPKISLNKGAKEIFEICKKKNYSLGLITDGRSVTQRNKLRALEIEDVFDKIVISEEFGSTKPSEANFKSFMSDGINEYFYIADNPKKDFITPNALGWTSICLRDKGFNIHGQNFNLPQEYLPQNIIQVLSEIKCFL